MNPQTDVNPTSYLSPEPSERAVTRLPKVPIRGLLPRLVAFVFRRLFGKVMSPVAVLYSRIPGMCFGHLSLARFAQRGLSLPPEVRQLIEQRLSAKNACTFCGDLNRAMVMHEGKAVLAPHLVVAAPEAVEVPAALRPVMVYVDELWEKHAVSEDTFAALRATYSDKQVAEIVWLAAFTSYHNLMAKPLGFASEGFCDIVAARRVVR